MADADQRDLLNIFQEARLKVPKYQRSYAWNKKQVRDLLDDIDYVVRREDVVGSSRDIVHYFGTVVLDDVRQIDSPAPSNWTLYHIVDGQQRLTTVSLIVGTICEELRELDEYVEVDTSKDNPPAELASDYRDIYVKYRNKDNGRRLQPATLTEEAYSKLVVSGRGPDKILEGGTDVLPARKLARAKEETLDWLQDARENFITQDDFSDASEEDILNYYSYLEDMLSAVGNTFEVTRYEVDDTAEAGRLFEVVNDRGKDLTTAEKVKSHLLYCAGEVEDLDAATIARDFNEAIETVTLAGGDEDVVDQFVERHWEMFTGETSRSGPQQDISELHRRIKQIDRYASLERDEDDLVNWINTYVQSLHESADAFCGAWDPEYLADVYDVDDQVINKLHSIGNSGAATNFRPLLMSSIIRLEVSSDEFSRIVSQCEVFAFRAYQVIGKATTLLRRSLKQQAHRMYVADLDQADLEELFGAVPLSDYYTDPPDAVNGICGYFDEKIGKRASEQDFVEALSRPDVINGSTTTNWAGFNNKAVLRYLFYEYERHLRTKVGDTGLETLVGFSKFDEEAQIEHIAPRKPETSDAELVDHEQNCHRLGNLAFLWPEDNQGASNEKYANKYTDTYNGSGVQVLETLPEEGWNIDKISEREERLINFCLSRWAGERKAYVSVPEDLTQDEKDNIRDEIQSHFGRSQRFDYSQLPTVQFITSGTKSGGDVEDGSICSSCGGCLIDSVSDGEYVCACGRQLERPSYQVKLPN